MTEKPAHVLLADIGGTHSRCAWLINNTPTDLRIFDNDLYTSAEAVFTDYLADSDHAVDVALLGFAGQVTAGRAQMLHRQWSFTQADIREATGARHGVIINDFEALAYAVPLLDSTQVQKCGGGDTEAHGTRAIIGPGTGLGVSGLLWSGTRWVAISGEGGHVTLAANNEEEEALCRFLRERYGRASAERAISGNGLVDIYVFLGGDKITAAQISRAAGAGDSRARHALDLLFALLAGVAGDLALTLGAHGGVYIGGGVARKNLELVDTTEFRRCFEAKGRYSSLVQQIPVFWILDEAPALQGLAYLAQFSIRPEDG
ncbi:MAG: glucokinase [Gammaproteobacteria bacterium]|nr:glucokinase [Gammaproteobacteria bacterium]